MTNIMKNLVAFFASAVLLLSNGSVSGQTTTVTIGTGVYLNDEFPICSSYGYSYSQQIYLSSEIGYGTGIISKIRFYCSSLDWGSGCWKDWVVYMGNTTKSTFYNTTDWLPVSSMTQVFSGEITEPSPGTWVEITLTPPFIYTNHNLVVVVDENTPDYSWNCTYWGGHTATTTRGITYHSDNINPDPASPPAANNYPTSAISQIQLVIEPALPMSFASATAIQASTDDALPNLTEEIIALQVVTSGALNPVSLTKIKMQMAGTNPIADVDVIRAFYTGNSDIFSTTNQFNSAGIDPATGTIEINGSQELAPGTNYFWITYDITSSATRDIPLTVNYCPHQLRP